MSDLSALANLSPEELEVVKYLGLNQGTRDPKQLPGRPQVWQVGNKWYLVYYVPGTNVPMVYDATQQELAEKFGGVDATPPTPDKQLTVEQFTAMSPWQAGRINEIRNIAEDPWTQFYADYNTAAELRPWLRDPDMLATVASAFLEGRAPTPDEISKTTWWQEHTAEERAWLEFAATGGAAELQQRQRDMVRVVTNTMLGLGLKNVNPKIIELIATKRLTGAWSEQYTNEQIKKLADPYSVGELNREIVSLVNDDMRRSRVEEDTVRQMASQWLGPQMGSMSQRDIERWAGRLRNNPDAKVDFEEFLRKQRLALFPKYTNPNLTYEDIVTPFRNLASNIWGQPIQDETMLIDLANLGDYTEAAKKLRHQGLNQGIGKVVQDALADLTGSPLGERVVQSAI